MSNEDSARRYSDWDNDRQHVVASIADMSKLLDELRKGVHDLEIQSAILVGELKSARELKVAQDIALTSRIDGLEKRLSAVIAAIVTLSLGAVGTLINWFLNGHLK